jgi:hypothetical protein
MQAMDIAVNWKQNKVSGGLRLVVWLFVDAFSSRDYLAFVFDGGERACSLYKGNCLLMARCQDVSLYGSLIEENRRDTDFVIEDAETGGVLKQGTFGRSTSELEWRGATWRSVDPLRYSFTRTNSDLTLCVKRK